MSELKFKDGVLLSQTLSRGKDGKKKLSTTANHFIDTLPKEVQTLAKNKNATQWTICSDGAAYLSRYINGKERKMLNECSEKNIPIPTELFLDACISSKRNIKAMNAVPVIRVTGESFKYLCNILRTFFSQVEALNATGDIAQFDLIDIIKRIDKKLCNRDSIFTVLCLLSRIFIKIASTIFVGHDSAKQTIQTSADWQDVPLADNTALTIASRTKIFTESSPPAIFERKFALNFKGIRTLCMRSLAFVSVMAGRLTIDNDFDLIAYAYNTRLGDFISEFKTVRDYDFFNVYSKYNIKVPSFSGMYKIPIRPTVVNIKCYFQVVTIGQQLTKHGGSVVTFDDDAEAF